MILTYLYSIFSIPNFLIDGSEIVNIHSCDKTFSVHKSSLGSKEKWLRFQIHAGRVGRTAWIFYMYGGSVWSFSHFGGIVDLTPNLLALGFLLIWGFFCCMTSWNGDKAKDSALWLHICCVLRHSWLPETGRSLPLHPWQLGSKDKIRGLDGKTISHG